MKGISMNRKIKSNLRTESGELQYIKVRKIKGKQQRMSKKERKEKKEERKKWKGKEEKKVECPRRQKNKVFRAGVIKSSTV